MRRFSISKTPAAIATVFALAVLAVFSSASAANLNYATLQSIGGPLTATQLEALRLSSMISSGSVGILVGITMLVLAAVFFSKQPVCVHALATSPKS